MQSIVYFPCKEISVAAVEVEEIVEAQWKDLGMPETLWHCHVKRIWTTDRIH